MVAHTAWFLPYGTPFKSVREACLAEFLRALRPAHEIAAKVMNVHYSKPPSFFPNEQVVDWHVHAAIVVGWVDIEMDIEGDSWNYLGTCPECIRFGLA